MTIRKRSLYLGALFSALGAATLLTAGEQYVGWITDDACAKSGVYAGADHQKHVSAGQPIVFVSEKDKQVFTVVNPEKVKSMVGQKVSLTGTAKGEAIEVEAVAAAK